jgi:hypothetical protein
MLSSEAELLVQVPGEKKIEANYETKLQLYNAGHALECRVHLRDGSAREK